MAYTKATKEGLVPMFRNNQLEKKATDIPQFELEKMHFMQLATDISKALTSPEPKTLIGKIWRNNHLAVSDKRLSILSDMIDKVTSIVNKTTNLQADLFISPVILEALIEGKTAVAKHEFELKVKEHEEKIEEFDHRKKVRKLELDVYATKLAGEIADTRMKEVSSLLFEKMANAVDPNNISEPTAKMIMNLLNPNAQHPLDFAAQEIMVKMTLERLAAEMKKMEVEHEEKLADIRRKHTETDKIEIQVGVDREVGEETKREIRLAKTGDSPNSK